MQIDEEHLKQSSFKCSFACW